MENLEKAHRNARKGKGWYQEVKEFEADLAAKNTLLPKLQATMLERRYQTSPYERFIKNDYGKSRIIYRLPYYPDRICQWAILQVMEPYLINSFTADTYSAIPGRGIHSALTKIQRCMRNDIPHCQYCLKLDVKHFYQSINHEILKDRYRRIFRDPDLLWLLEEIIGSIATAEPEDHERLSHLLELDDEPLNKWVYGREGESAAARKERYHQSTIGVPIGNYISQYSGNLYLSDFDRWIKEKCGIRYYFRYMDDVVIFGDCKEKLHQLRRDIDHYLQTHLRLTVKNNWQVFPTYKRGVDFLGYRVFLHYTLLRKSTTIKFKKKMKAIEHKRSIGKPINYTDFCSYHSYEGWLKSCNSYRLKAKYMVPLSRFVDSYYQHNIKGRKDVNHGCNREGDKHHQT